MLMILLQITGYGWTAICFLVLSVFVAVKILKRRNESQKTGCIAVGYVSLVVFILLGFSAMLTGFLGSFVLNMFTLPRYEAKVVDVSSYQKNDKRNGTTTMYRSIVAFTAADGTPVEIRTDVSSSEKRAIGEVVEVVYKPGMEAAEELSGGKYLLVAGGAVMLLIMGYFAIAGILYAMGARMAAYYRFGMNGLLYFILPLGMLFMLGALGYAVVLYFVGSKPDMPVWAVVVCSFFCLVLTGALFGYVRMLRERAG
jgi:hypothetical protein